MKTKTLLFATIAIIVSSCSRGFYNPNAVNNYGTQTQVILSQANFRIVKHVEFVIEINNSHLKRQDVEKSAYAELLRRCNLTGSQALINVSIEEVVRENANIFSVLFAGNIRKVKQYVAARATVIEFIPDNGQGVEKRSTTVSTDSNVGTFQSNNGAANTKQSINNFKPTQRTPNSRECYLVLAYFYKNNSLDASKAGKNYNIKEILKIAKNSSKAHLWEQIKDLDTSSLESYMKK